MKSHHSDTDSSIVTVNGEFTSEISTTDRAFMFGDGVYESMLFTNKKVPLLFFHLARLQDACSRVSIKFDLSRIKDGLRFIEAAIVERKWNAAKIRMTLSRKEGGRASYGEINADFNLVFHAAPIESVIGSGSGSVSPVDLIAAKYPLPTFEALAGIKHINRLPYILGASGITLLPSEEVFFCDDQQNVIETMHHNIFFMKAPTQIVTPKLDKCGVAGVLRSTLKNSICGKLQLDFQEENIPLESIENFKTCFIGNSVRGFLPVSAIGGVSFKESSIVSTLNKTLQELLQS